MKIFNYSDYRAYLRDCFNEKPVLKKSELAQFLNCQPGFISQVLNDSKTHFTGEHIIRVAEFFKLSDEETQYLFLLLQYTKAGSLALAEHLARELENVRKKHEIIASKIKKTKRELGDVEKAIYYSHWSYMAIHIGVSLPELNSIELLAKRLNLDVEHVEKVTRFLLSIDLLQEKNGKLSLGKTRIHLDPESAHIMNLHQNFRALSVQRLTVANDLKLNYSSILALSKKDAKEIRRLIIDLIRQKEKILLPSKEEELVVFNLDYFKL